MHGLCAGTRSSGRPSVCGCYLQLHDKCPELVLTLWLAGSKHVTRGGYRDTSQQHSAAAAHSK
jgi:hypothetical protein